MDRNQYLDIIYITFSPKVKVNFNFTHIEFGSRDNAPLRSPPAEDWYYYIGLVAHALALWSFHTRFLYPLTSLWADLSQWLKKAMKCIICLMHNFGSKTPHETGPNLFRVTCNLRWPIRLSLLLYFFPGIRTVLYIVSDCPIFSDCLLLSTMSNSILASSFLDDLN